MKPYYLISTVEAPYKCKRFKQLRPFVIGLWIGLFLGIAWGYAWHYLVTR